MNRRNFFGGLFASAAAAALKVYSPDVTKLDNKVPYWTAPCMEVLDDATLSIEHIPLYGMDGEVLMMINGHPNWIRDSDFPESGQDCDILETLTYLPA